MSSLTPFFLSGGSCSTIIGSSVSKKIKRVLSASLSRLLRSATGELYGDGGAGERVKYAS